MFVTADGEYDLILDNDEVKQGLEIEQKIVHDLIEAHKKYISSDS